MTEYEQKMQQLAEFKAQVDAGRIGVETVSGVIDLACELIEGLGDQVVTLRRLRDAWEFMEQTGTFVVPGRRDEFGKITGWALRTLNNCDPDLKFIIDVQRLKEQERGWPPWESPVDALLAYRDWLLTKEKPEIESR